MKTELRIGCSSFYNSYWKDIFYPSDIPRKQWFDYYCQHFNTYEINGTFYRFPTLKTFQDWFDKTPDDFLFSVKAPKEITHIRKFVDCGLLLKDFYARAAEGLKHKLAGILFQFPPSYDYSPEKLQLIISNLNPDFANVLEFRHKSWIPEVWNELIKHNITFCSVSYPKLPETVFTLAPLIYVRLHGNSKLFYSEYTSAELKNLKEIISNSEVAEKAFVYFNNTASAAGIINALEMKKT